MDLSKYSIKIMSLCDCGNTTVSGSIYKFTCSKCHQGIVTEAITLEKLKDVLKDGSKFSESQAQALMNRGDL